MKTHLSPSQIRALLDGYGKNPPCPAKVVAQQCGEWPYNPPSDAMLAGSYLDAILTTDSGETWLAEHPECVSTRGATKGELKKAFSHVPEMAERIKSKPVWQELSQAQGQVMLKGEIGCQQFIAILDWLDLDNAKITDLKLCSDTSDQWFDIGGMNKKLPFYFQWIEQLLIYQHLVSAEYGVWCDCYVLTVAENLPVRHILVSDDMVFKWAYNRLQERIAEATHLKQHPHYCMQCDYCAQNAPFETEHAMLPIELL
jgi:hypothetical protein